MSEKMKSVGEVELLTVRDLMERAQLKDFHAGVALMRKAGGFKMGRQWRIAEPDWRAWVESKRPARHDPPPRRYKVKQYVK